MAETSFHANATQLRVCLAINLPCKYSVFCGLQMEVLGRKLERELPDEARVIACRFPFPDWTPTATEGEGLDQAWAYDMNVIRKLSTQAAVK